MSLRVSHRPSSEPVAMSVLLDTNVVSELIRKVPESTVVTWISGHSLDDLYFSSVSEAELRYGVAILPAGRGRDTLFLEIEAMVRDAFDDRVLPFDSDAARAYGDIAAVRRSAGRPVAPTDCQIAAIAASHNMVVATRNIRDFEGMGIEIVDPWSGA